MLGSVERCCSHEEALSKSFCFLYSTFAMHLWHIGVLSKVSVAWFFSHILQSGGCGLSPNCFSMSLWVQPGGRSQPKTN